MSKNSIYQNIRDFHEYINLKVSFSIQKTHFSETSFNLSRTLVNSKEFRLKNESDNLLNQTSVNSTQFIV